MLNSQNHLLSHPDRRLIGCLPLVEQNPTAPDIVGDSCAYIECGATWYILHVIFKIPSKIYASEIYSFNHTALRTGLQHIHVNSHCVPNVIRFIFLKWISFYSTSWILLAVKFIDFGSCHEIAASLNNISLHFVNFKICIMMFLRVFFIFLGDY